MTGRPAWSAPFSDPGQLTPYSSGEIAVTSLLQTLGQQTAQQRGGQRRGSTPFKR